MTIPCSATYSLKLGARASLKVATKGSPKGKNTLEKTYGGHFSKTRPLISRRDVAEQGMEIPN